MFEKLAVYQKSVDYADQIIQLTQLFQRGLYCLTEQLNRAALSVPTNIAEGNEHYTKADRKNFFGIARGSVHECVPLMELCKRRKLMSDETADELKKDLEQIVKMISGLINGLNDRKR